MESIQTRGFTDPAKRAAEAAAIDLAERHTEQLLREYAARVDTHGGDYYAAHQMNKLLCRYGGHQITPRHAAWWISCSIKVIWRMLCWQI